MNFEDIVKALKQEREASVAAYKARSEKNSENLKNDIMNIVNTMIGKVNALCSIDKNPQVSCYPEDRGSHFGFDYRSLDGYIESIYIRPNELKLYRFMGGYVAFTEKNLENKSYEQLLNIKAGFINVSEAVDQEIQKIITRYQERTAELNKMSLI